MVVLGHTDVKKGGESAQVPVVHVWRWEGDEIKRLQILTDSHQTGGAARHQLAQRCTAASSEA